MLLHLLRHGQSTWNVEGRLQGQTLHVPLTDMGREQAAAAADLLASRTIAGVWCSDQLRAIETARAVAGRHRLTPHQTPLLREQSLGNLEGRLTSELAPEPVPEGVDISEVAWGGGESLQQVHARMRVLVEELSVAFDPGAEVVLVSHGDTLRVLLALLDGRGHREVTWEPLANCEIITRTLPGGPVGGRC